MIDIYKLYVIYFCDDHHERFHRVLLILYAFTRSVTHADACLRRKDFQHGPQDRSPLLALDALGARLGMRFYAAADLTHHAGGRTRIGCQRPRRHRRPRSQQIHVHQRPVVWS